MPDIPDPRNEGGLWCHEVLGHLDAYVAGSLSAADFSAVEVHLRACDQCTRFGGAYAGVVKALRSELGVPPPLDEGRASRLDAVLDDLLEDG